MKFNRLRRSAPVQGIVFDCDGTLLNSMPAWHYMESELSKRSGIPLTPQLTDTLNANTLEQTVQFFHEIGGLGESTAALQEEALSLLTSFYLTSVQAKPGATEFVEAMADRGIRMSVASSSPREVLSAGLNRVGISSYLQAVVSVADTGKSKRDPATILAAYRALNVPRDTVWGFEDSVYSIRVFRSQGFCTMGIYDSDAAGTFKDLLEAANHAVHSFKEIGIDAFLRGDYR